MNLQQVEKLFDLTQNDLKEVAKSGDVSAMRESARLVEGVQRMVDLAKRWAAGEPEEEESTAPAVTTPRRSGSRAGRGTGSTALESSTS
jgi:hypothetical protein